MDAKTLVDLSRQLRDRHRLCRERLSCAQANFSPQDYDDIFWGSPSDWPDTASAKQLTLANLLFDIGEASRSEVIAAQPCDYPRVFASFLDGCYTIRSHAGEKTNWKVQEHFAPFDEKVFRRNLNDYTDNSPERARWIIVGGRSSLGQKPRKYAGELQMIPRSPCMSGVALHADLTWDALTIHVNHSRSDQLRTLKLAGWGLSAYIKSVSEIFRHSENEYATKKMLAEKVSQKMISESGLVSVRPDELCLHRYLNRLRHLLPYAPGQAVRLTGWFSSELMKDESNKLLTPRFNNITYTYPYQDWSYE